MKKYLLALFAAVLVCSPAINAQSKAAKIDKLIKSYFDTEKFMGTVLVAENGKILYRKGTGYANLEWKIPNSPKGEFKIASISKTFTALLAMQLMQEGKLKPESRISEFLPYYRKDIGDRVTVHQLLTHSSGIPNYLQLPGFMAEKTKIPMKSLEDFIKTYCSNDLQFEPGEKFSYNNSGYVILGAIIEKLTGMTYQEVLKKKILIPAGMDNTGCDRNDMLLQNRVNGYVRDLYGSFQPAQYWDMSTAYAAGQIYSTADDLLKYHEALLGEKLLNKEFKDLMFSKYYPAFRNYYGYGWMMRDMVISENGKSLTINSHEGGLPGFNLYFARIPVKNQVAIILNNTSDAPLKEMSMKIFSILNGAKYELPKKSLVRQTLKVMKSNGLEAAMKFFRVKKAEAANEFEISETELNRAGYDLMGSKNMTGALAFFILMTEEFPKSGNAFDSLAEGYMNSGDKNNAIKYYQKSLELDPQNANAGQMIKKLKSM